ncbi:MAG: methionine synthase [Bacteroidota bacterium]
MNIEEILKKKILVLDGAMGTMIQRYNLTEEDFRGQRFSLHKHNLKGCNDLLCLTKPGMISRIHVEYLTAGADIIETNTFNAQSISLSDYGLEKHAYEINLEAAKIARSAADEFFKSDPMWYRFVAGAVGPTNRTASMSPDVNNPAFRAVNFDELVNAYSEQIEGLMDGNVDLLLVETIFDTLNAKAALFAISKMFEKKGKSIPVMVSGTITDASGRTLSGQTLEAFLISVSHFPVLSVGLNCAMGAVHMKPFLEMLADNAPCYICLYPNAGMPNQFGGYDETADEMTAIASKYMSCGLINIIGGCCGTTPEHITLLAEKAKMFKPHKVAVADSTLRLSGLEPVEFYKGCNFVNIGERTNVAGSKKFANLIKDNKYEEALSVAQQQIEGGAQIIDICMDDAMIDAEKAMATFLNLIASEPDIAKVPIMIDSSKWNVIESALKCVQGKSIVNSISLKEGEEIFKQRALHIHQMGAAMIVMALDEKGQADTFERKIQIIERAYHVLVHEAGIPPHDIIFDPNILAIGTGIEEHSNYAVNYIKTAEWIRENLAYCKISGGVSNLSFSFRGNDRVREAMHSVFLYHAVKAGMDMGIVNPSQLEIYDNIPADLLELSEDIVLNRRKDATERMIAYAETRKSVSTKGEKVADWRNKNLDERIQYALVKGVTEFVDADINEALKTYPGALSIVEGPLMNGMNHVGELFGSGKMFLPQVVKSARVMKQAVSILLPYFENDKLEGKSKAGKIILATVKGDVHDIGKNIAGVVLACNNFEVIDLGVMVPAEKILETVKNEKADILGLSGLITPSLEEMVHIAREFEREDMKIPIILGGATTSKIHTALRIATEYSQPVIHARDASYGAKAAVNLMSKNLRSGFLKQIAEEYGQVKEEYANRNKEPLISLNEARNNRFYATFNFETVIVPRKPGITVINDINPEVLIPYIKWTYFFHQWKLNGKHPEIFNDPVKGAEAKKLFEDAVLMLDEIVKNKWLHANGVAAIFPAESRGDDVIVFSDEDHKNEIAVFPFLRNQQKKNNEPNLCLADFIAHEGSRVNDHIGMFAVTAGIGAEEKADLYKKKGDDYNAMMIKFLADRFSEAFAEYLHEKVRKELWGYSQNENRGTEDLLKEKYTGIRPAPGYPVCPDHHSKIDMFKILDATKSTGISLTESAMMVPAASVCGWYFAHPKAKYFNIGKIDSEQLLDYAKRKDISIEEAEKWLSTVLAY